MQPLPVKQILGRGLEAPGMPRRDYKPIRYDMGGFDETCHEEVRLMHREAQWFINDVITGKNEPYWLTFAGASGIGKTHLATAIRNNLYDKTNLLVQKWKWSHVLQKLRQGEYEFLTYLSFDVDVLVLDDVGIENATEFSRSSLGDLLDNRLGKWTVLTTNLSAQDLGEQQDFRIASRIFRGKNIVVQAYDAPDYSFNLKRKTK